MLLYFVVYLLIGDVTAFGYGLNVMIDVYKKGYDLDKFVEMVNELNRGQSYFKLSVVFGMLIWPIRLYENRNCGQELISMYENRYCKES